MGLQERAEAFHRHDFGFAAEEVFQEIGKPDEVLVGLFPLLELHEDVHVAAVLLFSPDEGPEKPYGGYPEPLNLGMVLPQKRKHLLPILNG